MKVPKANQALQALEKNINGSRPNAPQVIHLNGYILERMERREEALLAYRAPSIWNPNITYQQAKAVTRVRIGEGEKGTNHSIKFCVNSQMMRFGARWLMFI